MSFWERNRALIYLAGGFLLAYLIVYGVSLAPNAAETQKNQQHIRHIRSENEGGRFFPEDGSGTTLSRALVIYQRHNERLGSRYGELEEAICRPLPNPLVPKKEVPQLKAYVRKVYNDRREQIRRTASLRNVHFSVQAQKLLGKELPTEYSETSEQDYRWLRQMAVVVDFLNLLFSQSDGPDGERALLGVESIIPKPGRRTGAEPHFLVEYPVETELRVSLGGLARILDACGRPETFFAVRDVRVSAAPQVRHALLRRSKPEKLADGGFRFQRWSEHFYKVNLRVVRVTRTEDTPEGGEGARKPRTPRRTAPDPGRRQPAVY
jgi:hypothetical protein